MSKIVPIFSGGGTKLSAHIGILKALTELDIKFEHIVGVSGGSIVSALFACGLSIEKIQQLALETDFKKFRGFSLFKLITQGGLCSGDNFEHWMDELLNGVTFKDIELNLHVLATDVNGGGPVVFNKINSPDLKISKAVRFSMSIPLFFSFQNYKEHILVDGAILSEDALYNDWAGDGTNILCFRLKSEQITEPRFKKNWLPLKQYVMMLIRTFMTAMSREYVHDNHWQNTIVINTGLLSPVDFNMSLEQKEFLFKVGYETALTFVPKRLAARKKEIIMEPVLLDRN